MFAPEHFAGFFPGPLSLASLIVAASPDTAVWIAAAGLCLIAVELNRPGLILPGSLGLLLVLLSTACLARHSCRPWAVGLLVVSAITIALNWWKRLPSVLLIAAALASTVGLRFLLASAAPESIHTAVAVICGVGFGILGAALSRIAFRARRLKAVN